MAGTTWSFSGGVGAGGRWVGLALGWSQGSSGVQSLDYLAHLSASLTPSTPSYSDITEEDLEEAGVQDPAHKRLLLDTLQLSK